MMKLTLYFVLIYQFAQLTQGFMPLQAINKLVFTPPGCLACYKEEAKNYFQNLNRLSPNCAEQEINNFNWISTKYFIAHICVYQTGTGFQSKYDSLQNYGNQVLRKFRKCLKDRLKPAGKNYVKKLTAIFENARITCENGNFLEKGLKGIRQIFSEPPPPPLRRGQKRKSKYLQNLPTEEHEPAPIKLTPVVEKDKATIVGTLPVSNALPSEYTDHPQETGEIQQSATDVASEENDNGTYEEIPELPSNFIEQDGVNYADPTVLEDSVEALGDQPALIEDSDNPHETSEIQPNETDVMNEENNNGAYIEVSEPSSNTAHQQNNSDGINPTTLEDSVNTFEDQPSPIMTDNLKEEVHDEKTNPMPSRDSGNTHEDSPSSIMTGDLAEKVQAEKVTSDEAFDHSENSETPDKILNKNTIDDDITPPEDLETSDNQLISPTTDTSSEIQNDGINPENIQDSTSSQSSPLINEETENNNLPTQVDPTLLPDDTSSDNLYDETSKDHTPSIVNASEDLKENMSLTNNAITEDSAQVQDDSLVAQVDPDLYNKANSPENLNDVISTLTKDNTSTEIQKDVLVPLEETLIAAPVGNTENDLPELLTDDGMTTLTNDPSSEDSQEILEPEDILKSSPTIDDEPLEKPTETTFEGQIQPHANDNLSQDNNLSQDLIQSEDHNITPLDNADSIQNYDSLSVGNLSEKIPDDQPTSNPTDTLTLEESQETTKNQSAPTSGEITDDLPPLQENDTPEDTLKSSLTDISVNETTEEIQSTVPMETKDPAEDSPLFQENNLQTGDDNSPPLKIDTSLDNSLETKSEEEILPQVNDSQAEDSHTKSEDEIIPQIYNSLAEDLNQTEPKDQIITDSSAETLSETQSEDATNSLSDPPLNNIPSDNSSAATLSETQLEDAKDTPPDPTSTNIPSDNSSAESLSETQFEDANDTLPDPSSTNIPSDKVSQIKENIQTPEIISKLEPKNSATEDATKFKNSDETSNENSEISQTDSASLEPMNLVERISTSTDDIPPSHDVLTATSPQEAVNDESPNSKLPQDDRSLETPTKAELYEKFHDALTHFATDTAMESDLEPIDKIISNDDSNNIENNLGDKIINQDSVNSETDSSSPDLSELKDQDLSKPDQNLESTFTSLEDDSATIEAKDSSSSTNNLLDAEVTPSSPSLENLPETEANDQNPENISPTADLTSLEDSSIQEYTPKLELSEESESVPKENIDDSSSIPEDKPSHEHLLDPDAAEVTPSTPSLENLPEKEINDQNPENNSPTADPTSLKDFSIQEPAHKLKLSEESDSAPKEKINNPSSIPEEEPSHEQSEQPDTLSQPTSLSPTNPSPHSLENLPEKVTNDQNLENIPPAADPTSSKDSPIQEHTPKLELSEESESLPKEKIDNPFSIPKDEPSHEQSEQPDLMSQPTTVSPTNDVIAQTSDASSEDHQLDSTILHEPLEKPFESIETNPTTVKADQVFLKENQPTTTQEDASQEKPKESTEADPATLETNITSDSSRNQSNMNSIPTEREIENQNQDKVEGKPKEIKDDIMDYEKEKTVIS